MTRRPWTTRALLSLALGLLTTLSLAWVAPLTFGPRSTPLACPKTFWIDDHHAGRYEVHEGSFRSTVVFLHIIFTGKPEDQPYSKSAPPPPWAHKLTHAMEGEGPAAGKPWWSVETIATGWPFRAFRAGVWEPWPSTTAAAPQFNVVSDGKGGLTLEQRKPPAQLVKGLYRFGGPAGTDHLIAFDPLPAGLALNTALFAGAWAAVILGVAAIRNRVWSRRGGCASCGYDLRGLAAEATCPECGRTVAAQRVPSTQP